MPNDEGVSIFDLPSFVTDIDGERLSRAQLILNMMLKKDPEKSITRLASHDFYEVLKLLDSDNDDLEMYEYKSKAVSELFLSAVSIGLDIAGTPMAQFFSENGKKGADVRHAASRERAEKIREIWATGKYSTKDICAEEEYAGLGFNTFRAARDALKGTPDPKL